MHPYFRSTLVLGLIAILTACGGGGDSGSTASSGNSPTTAASTPAVVPNGSTLTMTQNSSVLVPAGTTITAPNGNVVTINGTSDTVYTQAGAIVSVPANASGPANNLVSTGQATSGALSTAATVTALAGSATTNLAPVDGTGASAIFWGGGHLALDSSGNIIVSDRSALRKVTQAGVVTTLVPAIQPADWEGIAIDSSGNIYGAGTSAPITAVSPTTWAASIYQLPVTGVVKAFALDWETSTTNNSVGWGGIAVDSSGNLYQADGPNNRIVKFTSSGAMSVFAGNGTSGASDGVGTAAAINNPQDLTIDANGNLYFTDTYTNRQKSTIRKITANGTVSTIATLGLLGSPIAVDPSGNIYTTDGISNIVRLDSKGNVTTFNTGITSGFITSLVADSSGNLYADTRGSGAQILKISF